MLDEVFFAFQPIVSLQSMLVIAYEALARTKMSRNAFPKDLIPAEQNKRAETELVLLQKALMQPGAGKMLSVNLSATTLLLRQQEILQLIEEQGPFCIEILESQALSIEQVEQLIQYAHRFVDAGGCIALDDIGTGEDRLLLLCSGAVSILKTDRSLLAKPQLLSNVVATAKSLGMQVVVEGIETPVQLEIARKAKSDFAQGYLLGTPQPDSPNPMPKAHGFSHRERFSTV